MPWDVGDVNRHNKGLGDKQKRQWVAVANNALKSWLDDGRPQDECEASAIRQANSVVRKDVSVRFFKKDKEKQIVYGVVFEPDYVDAQGDWIAKDDIENAAHRYLVKIRRGVGACQKLSHGPNIDHKTDIVESYIAPTDFEHDGNLIKEGSWVVAMKIWDEDLWKKVKDEIKGFSAGGTLVVL